MIKDVQTSPRLVKDVLKAVTICIPMAMLAGTGGVPNEEYLLLRKDAGYAPAKYVASRTPPQVAVARTVAQNLDHIRATLKLTVTDLAARLGVTRQAVYDWQNGKAVAADRLTKIEAVARATDVVAAVGIPPTALVLNRKILDGKTLADFVFEGTKVELALSTLVQTLQQEATQRELLSRRLAIVEQRLTAASDFGSPAYKEAG